MTAKFDRVKVGDELPPYVHERVNWTGAGAVKTFDVQFRAS